MGTVGGAESIPPAQTGPPDTFVLDAYLLLAGAIRIAIEFVRVNERGLGIFSVAHLASLAAIALGIALLLKSRRRFWIKKGSPDSAHARHGFRFTKRGLTALPATRTGFPDDYVLGTRYPMLSCADTNVRNKLP